MLAYTCCLFLVDLTLSFDNNEHLALLGELFEFSWLFVCEMAIICINVLLYLFIILTCNLIRIEFGAKRYVETC
jgi:hypothetical protein